MRKPEVIRPGDRKSPPEGQTPGLHRETAIVQDGIWVGYVVAEPGVGGWHHHSDNDTYLYLLEGGMTVEPRDGGGAAEGRKDDFMYVPKGVVHREITPEGGASAVVVRVGNGPPVVNVDE